MSGNLEISTRLTPSDLRTWARRPKGHAPERLTEAEQALKAAKREHPDKRKPPVLPGSSRTKGGSEACASSRGGRY